MDALEFGLVKAELELRVSHALRVVIQPNTNTRFEVIEAWNGVRPDDAPHAISVRVLKQIAHLCSTLVGADVAGAPHGLPCCARAACRFHNATQAAPAVVCCRVSKRDRNCLDIRGSGDR